jgi:flagellar motor switch protein FliN/FliY
MWQSSKPGGNERTMSDTTIETTAPTLQDLGPAGAGPSGTDLSLVLDVPVELAVEIGRTTMTIRQTMALAPGSVVVLDRMAGEPVDLLVNGKRIARGEVVAIDEEFGLRITEVTGPVLGEG